MWNVRVTIPVNSNGTGGTVLQSRAVSYEHAVAILTVFLSHPSRYRMSTNYNLKMEIEIIGE